MSRRDPIITVAGHPCPIVRREREKFGGPWDWIEYVYHQDTYVNRPVPPLHDPERMGRQWAKGEDVDSLPVREWRVSDEESIEVGE